jgi:hypothetical protein
MTQETPNPQNITLGSYSNGPKVAYIIDIYQFKDPQNLLQNLPPNSTDSLINSLHKIGYDVLVERSHMGNFDKDQMRKFLESIILSIFPHDIQSVLLFISSHGDKTGLYTSDGNLIEYDDIIDWFVGNPSLNGKLKWFIFACCHGRKVDKQVKNKSSSEGYSNNTTSYCHNHKDVFITFESPIGYSAYPHKFVDTIGMLCDNLVKQGKKEISLTGFSTLLNKTMVEFVSKVPELNYLKANF